MKVILLFVILITLILLICYYFSNKNQNINRKENFSVSNIDHTDPITLPIYSISLSNTPFLNYVITDNQKKTIEPKSINSHIRFPDGMYVPIKITPITQFDTIQDQLLFYFLIDRIDDSEYDSYEPKNLEGTEKFNTKRKNLPLITEDKNHIYAYNIYCDNTNVENQFMKLKTSNNFMLPHLIDPYEIPNDINNYKLNDINLRYKLINKNNVNDENNEDYKKLIIPKLVSGDLPRSLYSLGISLFQFDLNPKDIQFTYRPSINYTETYVSITSSLFSYHKINCVQIKIPLKNKRFLNLENPTKKLKFKFILQSISPKYPLDDTKNLMYNFDEYPDMIYNEETNFNINKEVYHLNFYITDTEYHLIKDNTLNLIACLYSNINIDSKNKYPRRLYYEHILTFNLPKKIPFIKRVNDLEKRGNTNEQDDEFNKIREKYIVLPGFAYNKEIDVSPQDISSKESFNNTNQSIITKTKNKNIKKKIINSRISNLINYVVSYGLSKAYKKDPTIINDKYKKFIKECNIINKCYSNLNLLNDYVPIKFSNVENFEESGTISSNFYTSDNKLVLTDVISNNSKKIFNTTLDDYMYANNSSQYNSVRVTQMNYKNTKGKLYHGAPKEKDLEYYNGQQGFKLNSDSSKLDLKYLIARSTIGNSNFIKLKKVLGINDDNTVNIKFNNSPQDYIYSDNLLFKARATYEDGAGQTNEDGVYNKLIIPVEDNDYEGSYNESIPNGFKLTVYNSTSHMERGRRRSKSYCFWHSIGMWLAGALFLAFPPFQIFALPIFIYAIVEHGNLGGDAIEPNINLINTIITDVTKESIENNVDIKIVKKITNYIQESMNESVVYLNKVSNTIIKIRNKINLNLKERTATTENIINIKSFTNVASGEKPIEHPFVTGKKNNNKSLNDPGTMHTGKCAVNNDLMTIRNFKDKDDEIINVKPMSVNNIIMGSTDYHATHHNISYSEYQHGSPNKQYIEAFNYMNPQKDNKDGYNSYIDLSDADISLNDFGGLNYYETYKNYFSNEGNYLNGIMNIYDGGGRDVYYQTRSHGKGWPTAVIFADDYNHISANHNYVKEFELLYTTINSPYNVKIYAKTYQKLLEYLYTSGLNQLLLTNNKELVEDESDTAKKVQESKINDINKFMKDVEVESK